MRKKRISVIISFFLILLMAVNASAAEVSVENTDADKPEGYAEVKQLTEDDINEMNDGNALIVYNDYGYVSTLLGKYYDKPVTNYEEAIESLWGVQLLLGLGHGSDFFAVYGETDKNGYTYYTFQQKYKDYTVLNGTIRIIIGPDGYTAGLANSFSPNIGMAEEENEITKEDAEDFVSELYAEYNLEVYSEYTEKVAVNYYNQVWECWAVYTNNPDMDMSFDMAYLEHFVTLDGQYVQVVPTQSLVTSNLDTYKTEDYFKYLVAEELTITLERGDGEEVELTVPISKNINDGLYYMADPERMIIAADFYSFMYLNYPEFLTSETVDGWNSNYLQAYANYIKAYDFYKNMGLKSVDGFETPILIACGYCDEEGNPVDNAAYQGNINGWATFSVSDINTSSQALDVVAHEFTHGVTRQSMYGRNYFNEYGAISEAYSDIMGNICEMSLGMTDDTEWLIGETSGRIERNMGDPNMYRQPSFVGDVYYMPDVISPLHEVNDNGGVHMNSSLINYIAYSLYDAGMSFEDQASLWLTSIELLTPFSDFDDIHAVLLWSCRINGLLEYGNVINRVYKEEKMLDDRLSTYRNTSRNFCGRIEFQVDEGLAESYCNVLFLDSNNTSTIAYPDVNGVVSALLPVGTYNVEVRLFEGANLVGYIDLMENGWGDGENPGTVNLKNGDVVTLGSLYLVTKDEEPGTEPDTEPQTEYLLDMFTFENDDFSIMMPNGWRIETTGYYPDGGFSIKIWDPMNPSMQAFYYSEVGYFVKSEAAQRANLSYDSTGFYSGAPVLSPMDTEGLLKAWPACVNYQQNFLEYRFTELSNINVIYCTEIEGPNSEYGYYESDAFAGCSTVWDDNCMIYVMSTVSGQGTHEIDGVDAELLTLLDVKGVMAPEEQFDLYSGELAMCIGSLTFK